jgi:hypothetical protein
MPWTLAEFSKIETDILRKSVIDTLLMESNLMELVPWETIGQLATAIVRYQDLPSVGFRKINEAFAESTGKFEHKVETISLAGLDIDTDKAIARAKNSIADARAIQQTMALKSLAYSFNDKFINGDPIVDPEEFTGIKGRVESIVAAGLTGQKIDCAGTAGDGILLDTTERNNFLDKLDTLIYSIKGHSPDFLLMNKKCLLAVRAVLRREQLLNHAADMFGRTIDMYGTARLIDIGTKADQITEIITNTETTAGIAGGTECTSIYAVKFGVGELLWGIQEYPLEVVDLGEIQTKPVYRTRIDWPLGLADVDPRCVGRLFNIIPDGST